MAKYSEERLYRMRRMRKARRLNKTSPLFAFENMQSEYPGYTYAEFTDDLRIRRRKNKKAKTDRYYQRFGRFAYIEKLKQEYYNTRDMALLLKAQKLLSRISEPYIIAVKINNESLSFEVPATVSYSTVEQFVQLVEKLTTSQEVNEFFQSYFSRTTN